MLVLCHSCNCNIFCQATKVERIHKPCGFAYAIVTDYEAYKKPVQVYRGEDAAEQFILRMHEEYEAASEILHMNMPIESITKKQWRSHKAATHCYLCEETFKPQDKCYDHCHYRFALNIC